MKGSIIKRGSTYEVRWSTTDPATGKRRQHSKGGFRTKEPSRPEPKGDSAREFLNALLPKVQSGSWHPDAKLTVSVLLDNWLAAKASEGLRVGTTTMYRSVIDGWLVPNIGALRVEQLTPKVAGELVDKLRSPEGSRLGRGALSDRSVQLAVATLKSATAWAARSGAMGRDVLAGYKRPRIAPSERASKAWSAEEATKFLGSVGEDRLRAAWWLFVCRGLRRGELAGLRWADVDLDVGFLRVVGTRVMVKNKATDSTPKTNAGRRRVELDEVLVAELKAHRKRQLEERLRAGEAWTESGFVFADERGEPILPQSISRLWNAAVAKAKVRRIRLHDSRHSAATMLLEDGTPVHVVSKMIGHSRASVTLDVYAHAVESAGAEAGSRLTQRLAGLSR